MKKVFQKNQMIIMTLAVVIAVAGYVNYSQKYDPDGTKNGKTKTVSKNVAKESVTEEEYMQKLDKFVTQKTNIVKQNNFQYQLRQSFDQIAPYYQKKK